MADLDEMDAWEISMRLDMAHIQKKYRFTLLYFCLRKKFLKAFPPDLNLIFTYSIKKELEIGTYFSLVFVTLLRDKAMRDLFDKELYAMFLRSNDSFFL